MALPQCNKDPNQRERFMLDWIPTEALKEFINYHWYYLPESIAISRPVDWMSTMQELLVEAQSRGLSITLTITENDNETA